MSLHLQLHPPELTTAGAVLLALAGVAALVDWVAVARRAHRVEYVAKPLTLALLIATALALTPVDGMRRAYAVTALLFSLAGDVLLMLPGGEEAETGSPQRSRRPVRPRPAGWPAWFDPFALGLAAFLLAHVNWIAALRVDGPGAGRLALALAAVAVPAIPVGYLVLTAVASRPVTAPLRLPVALYMAALCVMSASAIATGVLVATAGGWLFLASDAVLALNRFVRPLPGAALVVAVTYHLSQALLVLWLIR